ncbi:hypothetical protein BJP34_13165 [Moorena producens PAL-8-15-08-1]|uniref:Uncharacterized protein n=1 Tax=Moorena producens PAL-8-15-08-1 TaxID=1458985 RepID=A0A1D8TRK9_9CYAN|nr:hypothetical protein [Moorena producens]AOX00278.1 hypothetical protein BJP34_13165 [Moorena producens PAL-8-15-08-1]
MANIKIKDISALNMTGTELFKDPESFMTELSDQSEQMGIKGGSGSCTVSCLITIINNQDM